jgi:hypothetical protein
VADVLERTPASASEKFDEAEHRNSLRNAAHSVRFTFPNGDKLRHLDDLIDLADLEPGPKPIATRRGGEVRAGRGDLGCGCQACPRTDRHHRPGLNDEWR